MPSWKELLEELERQPDDKKKSSWLDSSLKTALVNVRKRRNDRNVIFYASAFLQKAGAPPQLLQIMQEELNGLMAVMFGMDFTKGLTLILHTPGGITNAAETLVAYLWSKFDYIEVIVPAFAMSAGTMIAFGTNRVIMGHQSQLGPIDPQLPVGGRFVSARAVVDQYDLAKKEVLNDLRTAHVWAPILQSLGPALLQRSVKRTSVWRGDGVPVAHSTDVCRRSQCQGQGNGGGTTFQ